MIANKTNRLNLLILILSFHTSFFSQVRINEIFLTNATADLIKPDYNYVNWIELYNASPNKITLSDYYISDDTILLKKWKIPSTSLSPGRYLIINVDGKNTDYHTNFKPDPEGGIFILSRSNGYIVDKITYGVQAYNISYGRYPDGSDHFTYLLTPTRNAANTTSDTIHGQAPAPGFSLPGGFYSSSFTLSLINYSSGGTIYYTTNGSEPNENANVYTQPIYISSNIVIRARCYISGKAPSNIVTQSYFIQRKPRMNVVSIATNTSNLFDNTIGIYVEGTNGIEGNCYGRANWNREWERAANFEFFDHNLQPQLNQICGIKIAGGCSRTFPQKSLHITARGKYGKKRLNYPFFHDRDYNNFNSIFLRNGGNDIDNTIFRDAIFQKVTDNAMNLDHQSFEPAVLFINGQYYGIQTLYERSGTDLIEAKYGLTEDKIDMVDVWGNTIAGSSDDFFNLMDYIYPRNLSNPDHYKFVIDKIDLNEYIDYLIFQIFIGNHDWPGNNLKIWKKREPASKWRWIVFDTDFGFGLYSNIYHETVKLVFDSTLAADWPNPLWSTRLPRRLIENPNFKQTFLNRFFTHIATSFDPNRVIKVIDSVANLFKSEMPYHCTRWEKNYNNWLNNLENLRNAARQRPAIVIQQLIDWFGLNPPISLSYHNLTNIKGKIEIDGVQSTDTSFNGLFPQGSVVKIKFVPPQGYRFYRIIRKTQQADIPVYLIKSGDSWKFWDKGEISDINWHSNDFDDTLWNEGISELGYGDGDEKTTLSYGDDPNNKFPTYYFRKKFNYDSSTINSLKLRIKYDDGAVIYINGQRRWIINFPTENITYNTYANNTPDEAAFLEYSIDKSWLKEGENLIAIEIHQSGPNSSDISFDLEIIGYQTHGNNNLQIITHESFIDTITTSTTYFAEYIPINRKYNLIINEVAINNPDHPDEFGNYDPWIEIYNSEQDTISLTNFYFSYENETQSWYQIAHWYEQEVRIPPHSYKLLWADGETWQGPFHLPFKLEGNELITIYQKVGDLLQKVDNIKIPKIYGKRTIGRFPNLTGNFMSFCHPSPMTDNLSCTTSDINSFIANEKVNVWYTASNNTLNILFKNTYNNAEVSLFNLEGKLISKRKMQGSFIQWSLPHQKAGVYLIKVHYGNLFETSKIVIW